MADYMIDNDNTFLYKKLYEYDILSSKNIGTGYEDYKLDLKYSGMDINEAKTYGPKGKGYNNNKLAKSLTNIQVGDVLQSRRDGKKNVYKHSTYVTQIKDRQTFVTQHDINPLNLPAREPGYETQSRAPVSQVCQKRRNIDALASVEDVFPDGPVYTSQCEMFYCHHIVQCRIKCYCVNHISLHRLSMKIYFLSCLYHNTILYFRQ